MRASLWSAMLFPEPYPWEHWGHQAGVFGAYKQARTVPEGGPRLRFTLWSCVPPLIGPRSGVLLWTEHFPGDGPSG